MAINKRRTYRLSTVIVKTNGSIRRVDGKTDKSRCQSNGGSSEITRLRWIELIAHFYMCHIRRDPIRSISSVYIYIYFLSSLFFFCSLLSLSLSLSLSLFFLHTPRRAVSERGKL